MSLAASTEASISRAPLRLVVTEGTSITEGQPVRIPRRERRGQPPKPASRIAAAEAEVANLEYAEWLASLPEVDLLRMRTVLLCDSGMILQELTDRKLRRVLQRIDDGQDWKRTCRALVPVSRKLFIGERLPSDEGPLIAFTHYGQPWVLKAAHAKERGLPELARQQVHYAYGIPVSSAPVAVV